LKLFKQIFFEECEDVKLLLTLYGYLTFDHGGVKKRRIAIGVAMGYRVVSSNPEFDVHPFLRSWIAEREALVVGNRQQCIGIAMLGCQLQNSVLVIPHINFGAWWTSCTILGCVIIAVVS
jgi:hypothetical protein